MTPKLTTTCKRCGKPFVPPTAKWVYCGPKCQNEAHAEQHARARLARRKRLKAG